MLYLENTQSSHAFTPARIAVLKLLASQAAISLENARLYFGDLQQTKAYLAAAQELSRTGKLRLEFVEREIYWSEETFRIYGLDRATVATLDTVTQG